MFSRTLSTSSLITVSNSYTVTTDDIAVLANGTLTVTLYSANSQPGQLVFIKNIGNGTVTVNTTNNELLDRGTSVSLVPHDYLTVLSTDAQWWIIYAPASLG